MISCSSLASALLCNNAPMMDFVCHPTAAHPLLVPPAYKVVAMSCDDDVSIQNILSFE